MIQILFVLSCFFGVGLAVHLLRGRLRLAVAGVGALLAALVLLAPALKGRKRLYITPDPDPDEEATEARQVLTAAARRERATADEIAGTRLLTLENFREGAKPEEDLADHMRRNRPEEDA